jgi:hypothetical protein
MSVRAAGAIHIVTVVAPTVAGHAVLIPAAWIFFPKNLHRSFRIARLHALERSLEAAANEKTKKVRRNLASHYTQPCRRRLRRAVYQTKEIAAGTRDALVK